MYFRFVSIFGLISAFFVALVILEKSFLSLVTKGGGAFPIILGSITCFLCGFLLDRKLLGKETTWKSKIFYSPVIFLSGVLIGCLLNFLINAKTFNSISSMGDSFFDWFVKPAFWLSYIGIPASLIVGIICFGVHHLKTRKAPHS